MGYQHSKTCLGLIFLLFLQSTQAQFYYNDLVALKQWERKVQIFRKEHVSLVQEIAILPNGVKQRDYNQTYSFTLGGDTMRKMRTTNGLETTTTYIFNSAGFLESETEIQPGMRNQIEYTRDPAGNILRIENTNEDSMINFKNREIHFWSYDSRNRPTQLWRLVEQEGGHFDSTLIRFLTDSSGQITEEQTFKRNILTGFLYYYYDTHGNLSDIVRYNEKWKRLLPDQLFEYDENGNIIQRMQLTGSRDVSYLIWRYGFEQNGLLKEEALFNNKKEHTGSIRFTYQFHTP